MALDLVTGLTASGTKTATSGEQTKSDAYVLTARTVWTDGTGAASANKQYASGSVTCGTVAVSYDLAGALTNGIGEAAVFGTVQVCAITTGTANLGTIEAYGTTPWFTGTITLPPYTRLVVENLSGTAWPISAGTNDTINFLGTSGATYSIYVAGQ